MRLAIAVVLVVATPAAAERDVLREEMAKRDAALRAEQAAAANLAAYYQRLAAESRVKLARARTLIAEAVRHERAARVGSAFRVLSDARELALWAKDPLGNGQRYWNTGYEYPDPPTSADAAMMLRDLDRRVRGLNPSFRGICGVLQNFPTEIVLTQDGVDVPISEWAGAIPIDGGTHVWTARMDDVVFWRFEDRVRDGRSVEVCPAWPTPTPEIVRPAPFPTRAVPDLQIAR